MLDSKTAKIPPNNNTIRCPKCRATLTINDPYVTWCEQCDWNINPHQQHNPEDLIGRVFGKLNEKRGRKLYETLKDKELSKPGLTLNLLLLYIVGLLIDIVFLGLGFGAILFFIQILQFKVFMVGGILIAILVILIIVKDLNRSPKRKQYADKLSISREEAPGLYNLVDSIAVTLQIKKVKNIVLTKKFNASLSRSGVQHQHTLYLGLPLFWILTPQEKVALIAHELSHAANGDPTQRLFVYWTWRFLLFWEKAFSRGFLKVRPDFSFAIAEMLMKLFAFFPHIGLAIMMHFAWWDMQRAEYFADSLAASVSGISAMVSLLHKAYLGESLIRNQQKLRSQQEHFLNILRRQVINVPLSELERVKRLHAIETVRIDATHPPTSYRIALLQSQVGNTPELICTSIDEQKIEQELEPIISRLYREIGKL